MTRSLSSQHAPSPFGLQFKERRLLAGRRMKPSDGRNAHGCASISVGLVKDGTSSPDLGTRVLQRESHRPGDDVERPVNLPREDPWHCLLTATHQRCGA